MQVRFYATSFNVLNTSAVTKDFKLSEVTLFSTGVKKKKRKLFNRHVQQHDLFPSRIYKYSPLYSDLA